MSYMGIIECWPSASRHRAFERRATTTGHHQRRHNHLPMCANVPRVAGDNARPAILPNTRITWQRSSCSRRPVALLSRRRARCAVHHHRPRSHVFGANFITCSEFVEFLTSSKYRRTSSINSLSLYGSWQRDTHICAAWRAIYETKNRQRINRASI